MLAEARSPEGALGDDAALVARLGEGDRDAPLSELYDRFGAQLYGFALLELGDEEKAQEAVQETFVRVCRDAARLDLGKQPLRSWMFKVAAEVTSELGRPPARSPAAEVDGASGREAPTRGLDEIEALMVRLDARDALNAVSPRHREVLELCREGLDESEAAKRLRIPVDTARSRTHHALRALEVELEERGVDPGDLRNPNGPLRAAVPPYEVPWELKAETVMAVEIAVAPAGKRRRPRRRTPTKPAADLPVPVSGVSRGVALAAVGAALVLIAIVLVVTRLGGEPELEADLQSPGGRPATGEAEVDVTDAGGEVSFQGQDLQALAKGEYYELWLVGRGDSPGKPNRVSAGTFRAGEDGRAEADFHVAVDPKRYPVVSVTHEPADGNPERTGPEILSSRKPG